MSLHFTRRQAGWYRARGAHHLYSISRDGRLWALTILHEDTTPVSRDVWATLTFAKERAAEFERAHSSVCRHCGRPITFETRTKTGYKPREGWYDDLPVDALVCYKAANLAHVPHVPQEASASTTGGV